jgi:hypothetical protein
MMAAGGCDMKLTRKDFLKTGLAAAGAVVGIGGTGCGGEEDDGGGGGSNSCSTDIASNHGHSLTVAPADVEAGQAKTYTLAGGGHSHDVLVSPANFNSLQGGGSVSVTSGAGGPDNHSHSITITC